MQQTEQGTTAKDRRLCPIKHYNSNGGGGENVQPERMAPAASGGWLALRGIELD